MDFQITLTLFELLSIPVFMLIMFLIYRQMEPEITFKINKPYKWTEALKHGQVSAKLQKLEKKYQDKVRFYNLWLQIERIRRDKIPGDFAELGVFQGETAKIIHEIDPARPFRLFDTFTGFEEKDLEVETSEDEKYSPSHFSNTNLEEVKKYINGNENIHFYSGYFPDTAKDLLNEKYSFVHLDADLYKPSLAALHYFYPRLSPGGVIIIHDYNHNWDGLRNAVDEFLHTIPEKIIEVADWQGSAMIIKNTETSP